MNKKLLVIIIGLILIAFLIWTFFFKDGNDKQENNGFDPQKPTININRPTPQNAVDWLFDF